MKFVFHALCIVILTIMAVSHAAQHKSLPELLNECENLQKEYALLNKSNDYSSVLGKICRHDEPCRCRVLGFLEVNALQQVLITQDLSAAHPAPSKLTTIDVKDVNTLLGIGSFRQAFNLPGKTRPGTLAAALSIDPDVNVLTGGKGSMFSTMAWWGRLLKQCFVLIQELGSCNKTNNTCLRSYQKGEYVAEWTYHADPGRKLDA